MRESDVIGVLSWCDMSAIASASVRFSRSSSSAFKVSREYILSSSEARIATSPSLIASKRTSRRPSSAPPTLQASSASAACLRAVAHSHAPMATPPPKSAQLAAAAPPHAQALAAPATTAAQPRPAATRTSLLRRSPKTPMPPAA